MKHILVIGAGRSATSLLEYLKRYVLQAPVRLTIADAEPGLARQKAGDQPHERIASTGLDIFKQEELWDHIRQADVVISMVPAHFHIHVVKGCLYHKKHMLSASYVSEEIRQLDAQAREADILILKECGLDPGIDHMTAMEALDRIRTEGGTLTAFRSYTGGLVAPESDTNPWGYKFSWNPRNVVLAGQGVARYLRNGEYKYVPYHRLFSRVEQIELEGYAPFEGYPNRDSLGYRSLYGIDEIPTLIRGTLRKRGYCQAWNALVQLGMTDDSFQMQGLGQMRLRDFTNAFLAYDPELGVEEKFCRLMGIDQASELYNRIAWLGLFSKDPLPLQQGSPAQVLQAILEEKWKLEPQDKDMVVMQHIFDWQQQGVQKRLYSSLVSLGDDQLHTAMAKTVGWPLAIAARLLVEGKLERRGVCIPVTPDLYQPILKELRELGIQFSEREEVLNAEAAKR
ncbi:saccharopine dehydrogenase C-terminal domain-containing protein [Cesiribacter andamanensis]|uniref:Spermidine synthase n=1 Tax=Cesiribacter andamanensis AMV16 TaxID=1279009 RepID=M7NSQ9_9BACT|nr:saccharopine dehydrogenase C-terminal domain-containing protein [Cesiribacter andamanensis]EMR01534.1 Spermidine synthase [Cesiribacter andamanensis AMV16]